jgi:hypothetical protein
MMTTSCSKYVAFVRIAMARARRDRGELIGRMAFFAVILGVFSSLWRAVGEAGMPIGGDPKLFVWYLATTEWILLSAPMVHGNVQESIRRGDVVYQLGRPVSYPGAAFAEAAGMLAFRAPILAATAWICAFAFTGWAPPLWPLASTLPFGFASALLIARIAPPGIRVRRRAVRVVFLAWSHSVSWRAAPLALLAIVTSALVFVACGILVQSLAFWMGNIDTVARQLWELLVTFAVYPEPLFGGTLRLILFTVLPAGFVGYVPARLAERPSGALALLMISAAAAYLALAAVVFERGLKRYTSGSLFGVHG